MRAILVLIGLAALVLVAMLSLGLITLQTTPGSLPSVHVDKGTAPEVKADVAKLSVGMENKVVAVPTIKLDKPANSSAVQ
jgi:hypothetical protein